MMPRISVTTGTIVLPTHHDVRCHDYQPLLIRSCYLRAMVPHDYQSLLILSCYLHIIVPRRSVPTDAAVLSTHHNATTISHSWYHRDIHTSRCHDHQSLLMRSCYLHVMVSRLSVTTDTAVLSTHHDATTISHY